MAMTSFNEWWAELESLNPNGLGDPNYKSLAEEAWDFVDGNHKATLRSYVALDQLLAKEKTEREKEKQELISAGERIAGSYLHTKVKHDRLHAGCRVALSRLRGFHSEYGTPEVESIANDLAKLLKGARTHD